MSRKLVALTIARRGPLASFDDEFLIDVGLKVLLTAAGKPIDAEAVFEPTEETIRWEVEAALRRAGFLTANGFLTGDGVDFVEWIAEETAMRKREALGNRRRR